MKLYVATRKGLFTATRGAHGWELHDPAFLGAPVTAVLPMSAEEVYAAVGHGHFGAKLHRSRDGAKTFAEITTPRYPEGVAEEKDLFGRVIPGSLQQIWTMEGDARALFCGTLPGALFKSTDRGESWQIVRSLFDRPERKQWMGGGYDYPGIHSIVLDGNRVVLAVSSGGVWRSDDQGETWENCGHGLFNEYMPPEKKYDLVNQDPHRLSRCAASPDVMWIQHHNGAFHSSDGGRTFEQIHPKPSHFGFAVVAHPRDPQTAWFVPAIKDEQRVPVGAAMAVSRTRDGGRSFEVLREGLPQKHAYQLVYRHGLDIDPGGEVLAMASTTGALWISEDQGDSWATVSKDLPPVYAVRFG
jgi:photosystem II stability/assembly factor-like uncharacterized protein